jgi:hypothetical protein
MVKRMALFPALFLLLVRPASAEHADAANVAKVVLPPVAEVTAMADASGTARNAAPSVKGADAALNPKVSSADLRLLEAARSADHSLGFSIRDKGRASKAGAVKEGKRIFLKP